ncbi:MAG: hypothetical protein K6A65_04305 [Succinivibrionaceae bacterium]|nr:hypothetical protein [Succinivibrionaceae bacterium]
MTRQEYRRLVRAVSFTWQKALGWFLYVFCWGLGGGTAFWIYLGWSYHGVEREVAQRLCGDMQAVVSVFRDQHEDQDPLLGRKPLTLPVPRLIGPQDLTLRDEVELVRVQGQRRLLGHGEYEVRFVPAMPGD